MVSLFKFLKMEIVSQFRNGNHEEIYVKTEHYFVNPTLIKGDLIFIFWHGKLKFLHKKKLDNCIYKTYLFIPKTKKS
jgi:hypothetical protein